MCRVGRVFNGKPKAFRTVSRDYIANSRQSTTFLSVADKFDNGHPMYLSYLFPSLSPHTIKLTIVHRQDEGEVVYRNIL